MAHWKISVAEDTPNGREKYVFTAPSVIYLGHKIDKDDIHPTEGNIRAVQRPVISHRNSSETS